MKEAEAKLSLYYAEMAEYSKHDLTTTPDRIYSGASLGKAYLRKMGIHAAPCWTPAGQVTRRTR